MIIGIDLGTTHCAVAYLGDDGPQLIPNTLGETLTPSIVGFDADGHLLVGRTALEYQTTMPDRCASLFKRQMGNPWSVELNRKKWTPEELSSLLLRSLKEDAESHFGHEIAAAVITVPAYFNENQRQATIRAGQLAGLTVERILNEPTAAAIAYGLHEADEEKVIAVYDLGGGTFDISVVELFEGTLEVRASSGETFLGGEDFTTTMVSRILQSRGYVMEHAELKHPQMISWLRQECETAKRALSSQKTVTVRFPEEDGSLVDSPETVTVHREEFHAWTEPILVRTESPIRRALGDASLRRTDVDEVVLVGGATRMLSVIDRVRDLFQQEPRCRLNPDEAVALGAAVQAGLIARNESVDDLVVTDVAPFTLGIEVMRRIGGQDRNGYFFPMINRNTTIPTSHVERMSTVQSNQTTLTVRVFQGEARRIDDNICLGEFDVSGIPPGPAGAEVDIRFTYDSNGVLEVEACIVSTKKKTTHLITRHAQGLSEREIAAAVRQMQSIKTHPREEAKNRFLLQRAERIYRELSLDLRSDLEMLMSGFEEALELKLEESVEQHREILTAFLDQFDAGETYESDDDAREDD